MSRRVLKQGEYEAMFATMLADDTFDTDYCSFIGNVCTDGGGPATREELLGAGYAVPGDFSVGETRRLEQVRDDSEILAGESAAA